VYAWTIWCGPCRQTIKEKLPDVKQYLDSTGVSVGLMAICADDHTSKGFFELHSFMQDANIESYFLEESGFAFHDRWALNSYFGDVLKDYEDCDGVPIVMLVDSSGKALMQDGFLIASQNRL